MAYGTSPAEKLKQLQADFETNQRDATRLKALIADVTKAASDIDQKNKDFEKAAAGIEKQVQELKEYADCKKRFLEPKVPYYDRIVKKLEEAKEKLRTLRQAADDATKAIPLKEIEVIKAKMMTAEKQKAFDEVAQRAATNAAILKEVADLKTAVEKEGAANNFARMYFLILVMINRLQALKLTPPQEYAYELNKAGAELAAAAAAQREAEVALEKAKADEKAALKAYQDEKAKWVKETTDSIPPGAGYDKKEPPPSTPPPGSGYEQPTPPPSGYEKPTPPPPGYEHPTPPPPGYEKPTPPPSGYEKPTPPPGYEKPAPTPEYEQPAPQSPPKPPSPPY